jgi:hypothetical protein
MPSVYFTSTTTLLLLPLIHILFKMLLNDHIILNNTCMRGSKRRGVVDVKYTDGMWNKEGVL